MAFVFHTPELQPQVAQAFKLAAFAGFLAAATLFIGFNHQVFELLLGEKSKRYWWAFFVFVMIPLLVVIYVFSYIFGDLFSSTS